MGELVPLNFRPGINREGTSFSNEGGWWDCDKVRFRYSHPETIGGWSLILDSAMTGKARNMTAWATLAGDRLLGVGTHLKYYILQGASLYDVHPIRSTTSAGDVTFSATNGSSIVDVSDTAHGATLNDYVTFSGAVTLGGNVTAAILNAEHKITSITDDDNYQITVSVTADGSDTGNGGASVVGEYQINAGLGDGTAGVGWGSDPWGDGGWGAAGTQALGSLSLRTWSHDNFGEDLVLNPRNSGVYYWDQTSGTSARAVNITTLSGSNLAPTVASHTLVSDQDRHIVCFGCDPEDDIGTQDPLLIRWSDQENAAEWQTLSTNTAGSIRVSSGSSIITAIQTKREILIFTDASIHTMQFIGAPYTFGVQEVGRDPNIISPNAAIAANDVVYWMADGRFMMYDGVMREVPCSVKEYVFNGMNRNQRDKVIAGHNAQFNEVWWFYQSTSGSDCDRYVIYNYAEEIWYYGSLDRTAWLDMGLFNYPIGADDDGYLYYHEFGLNDGSQNPEVGISAYIESSQQDIESGGSFMFINRVIPDLTFRNSEEMPMATITLKTRRFPGNSFNDTDDDTVTQSASSPVEIYTEQLFVRLRGRSVVFRIESSEMDTAWRLGVPRIEIRKDGRR